MVISRCVTYLLQDHLLVPPIVDEKYTSLGTLLFVTAKDDTLMEKGVAAFLFDQVPLE